MPGIQCENCENRLSESQTRRGWKLCDSCRAQARGVEADRRRRSAGRSGAGSRIAERNAAPAESNRDVNDSRSGSNSQKGTDPNARADSRTDSRRDSETNSDLSPDSNPDSNPDSSPDSHPDSKN